jgi:hypothetical protein
MSSARHNRGMTMRQLILHMITSLDGFSSTPDGAVNDEAQ